MALSSLRPSIRLKPTSRITSICALAFTQFSKEHLPGLSEEPQSSPTKEMLHDNFLQPLSLSQIAVTVGVHPVYLATAFRRHYQFSIGEYRRRLRGSNSPATKLQRLICPFPKLLWVQVIRIRPTSPDPSNDLQE